MNTIVGTTRKEVENCKQKDWNTRCKLPPTERMDVDLTSDIASLIDDNSAPTISAKAATGDSSSNEVNMQRSVMNTNVTYNDVVILLSDSEDEDNTMPDVQIRDVKSVVPANNKAGTVTYSTKSVVVNDIDSSVIMLDASSENTDSSNNFAQKCVRRTRSPPEKCYKAEQNNVTQPTTNKSVAAKIMESTASNDSQNNESTDQRDVNRLPEVNSMRTWEKKQCINFDCKSNKKTVTFCNAPIWALNHFNVPQKVNRDQFVCENCFDISVNDYERMCATLVNHQPLLMVQQLPGRSEVVEIIDSTDEDNDESSNRNAEHTEVLPVDTLTLLEEHLEDVVKETFERINFERQIQWTDQILKHKLVKNEATSDDIDVKIKSLQKLSDSMYEKLYKSSGFLVEDLPPFDLNENKQFHIYGPTYPPHGEVVYAPVDTNSLYYAVRATLLTAWIPCKVTERVSASVEETQMYEVRFLRTNGLLNKTVPGNHLAYGKAPTVRLSVGIRVIAQFQMDPTNNLRSTFFPGIIAEPLQAYNRWRYLVFFDDGYAQYVTPDNIRLICTPSPNVWVDVYPGSASFIKSYLEQYKTRPMVQVKRGQRMITEWNSEWVHARVQDIDGSLVQMRFEKAERSEWIYRGSMRLGPMFKDSKLQKNSVIAAKRNGPAIKYATIDDDENVESSVPKFEQGHEPPVTQPANIPSTSQVVPQDQVQKRSVARKHVTVSSRPQPVVQHMNSATIYIEKENRPKGKVVHHTANQQMPPPRKFVRHRCGVGCLFTVKHNISLYGPLAQPLLSGWDRNVLSKKTVVYRAPCGRNLKNMTELHQYLRDTDCSWNVDNFNFNYSIHCLAEYVVDACFVKMQDLSNGCEPIDVPCVNYYDNTMPPPCTYSAKVVVNEGVNMNLDTNFLCGCDCEDDCMDKSKCQCWKLTLEGAKLFHPNTPIDQVGYEFKRLYNPVPTGIYECNSRCKCSMTCMNRVVQHPLQLKLQVFKTKSRGWGLQCLNDIPKGSFICVYVGDLLTDTDANISGRIFGDEYLAELDYIEVVESLKEDYEAEVLMDDDDVTSEAARQHKYNTRLSVDDSIKKKVATSSNLSGSYSDEEDTQRQIIGFVPNANSDVFENSASRLSRSIHQFYGKNERAFTMDAKKLGNIGRYFNHSCAPNLFVQNVFVDTQDLRFPWVAFFAQSHIQTGSELTWNYNYVVGSVPGKVLYCECGAKKCRGRLL